MFTRILRPLFKKAPVRILSLSLFNRNRVYMNTIDLPSQIPLQIIPAQIELPQSQSYYIVVYDSKSKQALEAIKTILSNQKQKIFMIEKDKYQAQFGETVMDHLTVFYKGKHLPFRIKLDISKGDILSQARNIESFVTQIKSQQVDRLAKGAKNSFNNPLIVVNVYNQQNYSKLKGQISLLARLDIINPLHSKVYIIRHPDQNHRRNWYQIMRNDLLSQLQNTPQIWDCFQQDRQPNNDRFVKFFFPSIHVIREYQDYSLFSQQTSMNPERYSISVNINSHDPQSSEKLKILHSLYKLYHRNFNFVVFTTSKFKSVLLHTSKDADTFAIYNYHKQLPSNVQDRTCYQKLYIGNYDASQSFTQNLERIRTIIDKFIDGQVRANELNVVSTEKHFEINSSILKTLMKYSTNPFSLRVCYGKCKQWSGYQEVQYWIDSSVHNLGFDRETCLHVDPAEKIVRQKVS